MVQSVDDAYENVCVKIVNTKKSSAYGKNSLS